MSANDPFAPENWPQVTFRSSRGKLSPRASVARPCGGCGPFDQQLTNDMRRILPNPNPGTSRSLIKRPVTYVTQPPKPWEKMEPRFERAIVIPWLSTAAMWKELRYALRSIEKFWEDKECPIVIVSDRRPAWLDDHPRVECITVPEYKTSNQAGFWRAWQIGIQIAREIAWWNDDIYLLRPTGWDDIKLALTEGEITEQADLLMSSNNGWRKALGETVAELKKRGHEKVMRYATHTPYYFEIEKSWEILNSYYLHHKGSWCNLYFNHHTPERSAPAAPHKTEKLPHTGTARFLNHRHNGPDSQTKIELERMFATPAAWERGGVA